MMRCPDRFSVLINDELPSSQGNPERPTGVPRLYPVQT